MIDLPTLQAILALGALLMLIVSLFYWMLHNTERNIREEWRSSIRDFRADMLDQMNERMDHLTNQMNERMEHSTDQMNARMDRLSDRMDQLSDQMDRNHREILALLENHTHADGTPAVFHRVTTDIPDS